MMKRHIFLLAMLLTALLVFSSCGLNREPWPASEGYQPAVDAPTQTPADDIADDTAPDGTAVPTGAPTIDPDYNG